MYISKETRLEINERATDTAEIQSRYTGIQPKVVRNTHKFDCPQCHAVLGLEIVVKGAKKGVFKCFHCDLGGKGGPDLLQKMHGLDWKKAYEWLANDLRIDLPEQAPDGESIGDANKRIAAKKNKVTFCDLQLHHSGIGKDSIKWMEKSAPGQLIERHRYTPGTITEDGYYTVNGDDMVLHYIDLDGNPIEYKPKNGKARPLIRVRYKHPDLHTDKSGKPIKYRSPYDSGSHLWLPMSIISAYKTARKIKTLYVVEGEKKSDKMCLHGFDAVAIMGIHNLAFDTEMPRQFELLISRCEVEEVVFVVDSDWQQISVAKNNSVDQRPRTFLRAVQKFREYFYHYRNSGIDLRIFMVAGTDQQYKGFDDLLMHLCDTKQEVAHQPGALFADVEAAIIDATGKGQFVQAFNIHPLRVSDFQLSEKWYLDDKEKFFKKHFDSLKELGEFKFSKLTYFYNTDTKAIELAQQILPAERFWDMDQYFSKGREVTDVKFNYDKIRRFLFNRGIGLYEYSKGQYRPVRRESHLVYDVTPQWIQRFVVEFAESSLNGSDRDNVVQMLLRGNTQFLGPNNLNYMYLHQPQWIEPRQDEQIMVFRNCFWRITADAIEQRPLSELSKSVWESQVIPFDAQYIGHPLVEVNREEGQWKIKEAAECNGDGRCEIFEYIKCVSKFFWQKEEELRRDSDGTMRWAPKDNPDQITPEDLRQWKMHIVTKLIGWGYKLRTHRDLANMRAVICMDGLESAVGRSQGGSGKSIYALATTHCQPMFTVDGKTADLKQDKFLYHGVDERTREIVFDDVPVNFNFELLFSQITNFIRVKPFQGAPITIPAPVFTLTTNHSINGEGNSFKRRQYFLGFSNFFNEHRTPANHFGHMLFTDWDHRQWNLYYNLMATAIQVYMKYSDLGRFCVESDDIDRRKRRQKVGEDFLDFAETYFVPGYMLNRVIDKTRILNDFFEQYPEKRRFMNVKNIKEKCEQYAQYKGYEFNPGAGPDGRIKSTGIEFIVIADDKYDANNPGEKIYQNTQVDREPDAY